MFRGKSLFSERRRLYSSVFGATVTRSGRSRELIMEFRVESLDSVGVSKRILTPVRFSISL